MPVQFGPPDDGHDVDADELARLGVTPQLIDRLRAWQEGWEERVAIPADPREFTSGRPLSVRLARQLQAELPAHEIYLYVNGCLRPAQELSP
jgi:hypothetical protein